MVAIGITGAATGITIITTIMISSLSVTLASQVGGAGAGVRGGAGATRTTTVMAIRTTAMATEVMAGMAMDRTEAMAEATDTATTDLAATPEWPNCSAVSPGPAIIMAPLMESWGPRPGEPFALMSATMVTQVDLRLTGSQDCDEELTDSRQSIIRLFGWLTGGNSQGARGEPPVSYFRQHSCVLGEIATVDTPEIAFF
jgi:hypothetical protein